MKSNFIILRSVILVIMIYIALILNNSFVQFFSNQKLLSTIVLSLILGDLFSNMYKFSLSNQPGLKLYLTNILTAFIVLVEFPIILNYFIIITFIVVYLYIIPLLSTLFSTEDQMDINKNFTCSIEKNFVLKEKKGLLFSEFLLAFKYPLTFLSKDDMGAINDFLKNNYGFISNSEAINLNFTLFDKGLRYLPFTKNKMFKLGFDLEKIIKNLILK